jgi:hypothetical protein
MSMYPMEPWREVSARQVADQRRQMREAQVAAFRAHSRTGRLARFLQRMADRIDPTGEARKGIR